MKESTNPDGSKMPFTRFSKDMKFAEIVVCGVGPIYRFKIGTLEPEVAMAKVNAKARDYYQFENFQNGRCRK